MEKYIKKVLAECRRQDSKWGVQNHNLVEWIAILTEETGEAAREAVDCHFAHSESSIERLEEELIQVAAVVLQALQSIDRQKALATADGKNL
jgi:Zn-finger protein